MRGPKIGLQNAHQTHMEEFPVELLAACVRAGYPYRHPPSRVCKRPEALGAGYCCAEVGSMEEDPFIFCSSCQGATHVGCVGEVASWSVTSPRGMKAKHGHVCSSCLM